jgi:amylosucrase
MQNVLHLGPEARELFLEARAAAERTLARLPERDRQIFLLRLERWFQNLVDGLRPVYGRRPDWRSFLVALCRDMAEAYAERPEPLKELDLERDLTPDWFQRESMLGYVFYVDRFSDTLAGLQDRLDYLSELGATYLHLMSTLRARGGENDGGYAIADYREVEPSLGDRRQLRDTCTVLREKGISVCIDLVLNHCADSHAWARRALAGEQRYQDYFYLYDDRSAPDAYERTLPEIFPDLAPGNFTYKPEIERWVWTTFHDYQWDLNWANPQVFLEMVRVMNDLANLGVEVFRLDAVAFLWKRLGTDCQNQPEVHDLLQGLRACSKIATPAVAHKAEAIVSPDDLIHYFGTGRRYGKVSNIAYHNSLMVQFWSALASRDTRLMTHTLREFPRTPASIAWGTYLRCHDDIGWAITDEDAAAVGLDAFAHRSFLSDYYSGAFPGSHARGMVFGFNPRTQDRRISGMAASLAGLEKSLEEGDERTVALSIERILLGHALILGFGGIPLLYMGDEIGMTNDYGYVADPLHADDNRWLHRPRMDWRAAERRHGEDTVEGRIFQGVRRLVRARSRTPHLHASYTTDVLDVDHPHLFVYARPHPLGTMVAVLNLSDHAQALDASVLHEHGVNQPYDQIEQTFVDVTGGVLRLTPYQRYWLI